MGASMDSLTQQHAAELSAPMVVGVVVGAHGVKGWVKIRSFTQPIDNILDYQPWLVRQKGKQGNVDAKVVELLQARVGGKFIVAQFAGVEDRDQALSYRGAQVLVSRSQLPELTDNQFYWTDLVGLEVKRIDGTDFGRVVALMETGANDVLVVQGDQEYLIPFVHEQVVKDVDIANRVITVDWDPDF